MRALDFSNDAYNPDDVGTGPSGGWGQWHKDRYDDFVKRAGTDPKKWTADDNFGMFKHEMEDTETGRATFEGLKNGTLAIEDGVKTSVGSHMSAHNRVLIQPTDQVAGGETVLQCKLH